MEVMVLAKYVPNPQGVADLGPDGLAIREGVESALDPTDEYGVEAGLQLVEEHGGGVTVVTMGPESALAGVRRALAMGAHKAMLISDDRLRGADVLVTARVLAAAITRRPFDLIVAGTESTDGYTGTLPVEVAELLDVPSATFARRLTVADGSVRIERQTPSGHDVVEAPLPALVTVTSGADTPRYPTMKGIMQAKKKPVEQFTLADLGLSDEDTMVHQTMAGVTDAPPRTGGEVLEWDDAAAARLLDLLTEAKVI